MGYITRFGLIRDEREVAMDGRSGTDAERFKLPTYPGSHRWMPRHEYQRDRRTYDRNYSLVKDNGRTVELRLDFPGAGLADIPDWFHAIHFETLMRDAHQQFWS